MKPRAYLIQGHQHEAVTLDHAKAIDYAAQRHGVVRDLVLGTDARDLLAALEAIDALVSATDPASNIPLIREACARVLKP